MNNALVVNQHTAQVKSLDFTIKNVRVLASELLMQEIHGQKKLGVPVTKIINNLQLSISRSALVSLLDCYIFYIRTKDPILKANLFPEWLDKNSLSIQRQPHDVSYKGRFPWGQWYI